jgi:hypothetical protein
LRRALDPWPYIEFHEAIREYSIATDARAGIGDYSSVTEYAVSSEFVREIARREPAMTDVTFVTATSFCNGHLISSPPLMV